MCDAVNCQEGAVTWIPTGELSPSLLDAVFEIPRTESYEDWASQPQVLGLCRVHYRQIRRRDGYTLGYRLRNGKIRAYVKEEHF